MWCIPCKRSLLLCQTSVKTETAAVDKPNSVVDEVIWVVGDEPILKSEVEIMRLQSEAEGSEMEWRP